MSFMVKSEKEAYGWLLGMHLRSFARRLKLLPENRWDWTPDIAAPTPRILATHALEWLICDRQHIEEPNVMKHSLVPETPKEPTAMIAALEEETENWMRLIEELTPEELDAPVRQFGGENLGTVRGFVCHMIQNVIYKNGQFATLFFALGLDGTDPYDAPWPNRIYEEVWAEIAADSKTAT